MTLKAREFDHLVNKLGFEPRKSGDRLALFRYEGKPILRTKRSWGSGDIPYQHQIRQQMKLDDDQLRRAKRCKLDRDEYIEMLRTKGLI